MKIKFLAVCGLLFILGHVSWAQDYDYVPEYSPLNVQKNDLLPFKYGVNVRLFHANPGSIIIANGVNQGTIESFKVKLGNDYPNPVCWFLYKGKDQKEFIRALNEIDGAPVYVDVGEYPVIGPSVEVIDFKHRKKERILVRLTFMIDLELREKNGTQSCLGTFPYLATCEKKPRDLNDRYFSLEELKKTVGVTEGTVLSWK